jgi:hypothetical protein
MEGGWCPGGTIFFGLACRRFFTLRRGTGFAESSSPSFAMYCAIKVMRRLEGELCQIFLEESPKLLQKLREAIADADPDAVMRAAHSIKGELAIGCRPGDANCPRTGGHALWGKAEALERLGGDEDLLRGRVDRPACAAFSEGFIADSGGFADQKLGMKKICPGRRRCLLFWTRNLPLCSSP